MINLRNVADSMIPAMVYFIILFGKITILLSVTVAIYRFIRRKQSTKEIGLYLVGTLLIGILVLAFGSLVNYIAHYEIHISNFKYSLPLGYIASLVVFFIGINNIKRTKRK